MNIKRFVKKERTLISMVAGVVILLIVTPLLQHGNAQTIYDNVAEDEVIVCVNGNVIEMSGNICKVFTVDGDGYFKQEITLDQVQEDLYKNPNGDTFQMDVRD